MKTTAIYKVLPFLTVCLSTVLLAGCGDKAVKQQSVSDTEACNRLQAIIDDHPNQFKKFRKSMVIHRRYNSWSADKIIPSARECQVWEWSTGLTNYSCEWKADDENQAFSNYQKGNKVIQECLGSSWKAETNTTSTGGQRTLYSREDSSARVSVRYFKESRGWPKNWYNNILIGDKSNLNTPMQ